MSQKDIERFREELQCAESDLKRLWETELFSEEELLELAGCIHKTGDSGNSYLAGLLLSPLEDFKKEQERYRRQLDILYSRVQIVLGALDR